MAEILGAATTATKYFLEVNQVTIDNPTFKLFYKATTTLLLACSLVTSSKQFFGDPINCEVVRFSHQVFVKCLTLFVIFTLFVKLSKCVCFRMQTGDSLTSQVKNDIFSFSEWRCGQ